ncbi:MAG: STAS domain-containing protein [bacterium]
MKIELSEHGKYTVVKILERFDVAMDYDDFNTIFDKFLKENKLFIAVDFAKAQYITSSIISVLIHFYKNIKEKDGDLSIIAPNQSILNVFDELNLADILHICPSFDSLPR